jgi:hypothetical protein
VQKYQGKMFMDFLADEYLELVSNVYARPNLVFTFR